MVCLLYRTSGSAILPLHAAFSCLPHAAYKFILGFSACAFLPRLPRCCMPAARTRFPLPGCWVAARACLPPLRLSFFSLPPALSRVPTPLGLRTTRSPRCAALPRYRTSLVPAPRHRADLLPAGWDVYRAPRDFLPSAFVRRAIFTRSSRLDYADCSYLPPRRAATCVLFTGIPLGAWRYTLPATRAVTAPSFCLRPTLLPLDLPRLCCGSRFTCWPALGSCRCYCRACHHGFLLLPYTYCLRIHTPAP